MASETLARSTQPATVATSAVAKVLRFRGAAARGQQSQNKSVPPRRVTNAIVRTREYLTPDEVAALETAVPADAVAGTRYPAPLMAHLDSER